LVVASPLPRLICVAMWCCAPAKRISA
jgi:hypothetical protein